MDLTRLYNLTTPELRDEAERMGVTDTYAMSRGQLIHAIRSRAGTPEPEGLLGKVFGFARWALQAAGETSSGTTTAPKREPMPVAAPEPVPASEPASESVPEPASESVPAPAPASEPAAAPTPAPAPTPASPPDPDVDSGPPGRPPAGVFTKSNGLFDEPFPTRTMARILADQGHFKRSLAIYGHLLDEQPANMELRAEADGVRARSRVRRSQV